jgi:hypothetical protein
MIHQNREVVDRSAHYLADLLAGNQLDWKIDFALNMVGLHFEHSVGSVNLT